MMTLYHSPKFIIMFPNLSSVTHSHLVIPVVWEYDRWEFHQYHHHRCYHTYVFLCRFINMIIIVVIILVYSFVDEKVENCENDNRKEAHHKEVSHLRKNIDKCIFNVYNYIYTTYTIIYSIYMYIPFVPNVQSCNLKLPICSRSSSSS